MLKRFRLKPAGMVGISIQPKNIHFIQLKKGRNSYLLERIGRQMLPESVFEQGRVHAFATLTRVLAEMVHQEKLHAFQAAVCVPANQVKMHRVVMPSALTDEDVTAEIAVDIHRSLPGKKEVLAIDFQRRYISGALESPVIYAAARGEYVNQYANCLREAGLVPAIIDIDILALLRVVRHALQYVISSDERLAVWYFGHDYAVLVAAHQSEIIFCQQWDGQSKSTQAMTVMEWVDWCCQTYAGADIASVAVGGDQNYLFSAAKIIANYWSSNVYEIDPFAQMSGVATLEKSGLSSARSSFLLACGLAMRERLPWLK